MTRTAIYEIFNDDFNFDVESTKPNNVYYTYNINPLEIVCALKNKEWSNNVSVYDTLQSVGLKVQDFDDVSPADQAYADEISKHFKNSILMRRLKGLHISKFMKAVEELIDSPQRVNVEYIKILVKLPQFYEESKETTRIFSQHASLEENTTASFVEEILTFAGKVKRSSKHETQTRYYFSTKDNNLVAVFVNTYDISAPVWKYISKKGKIRLTANLKTVQQPGHEFYLYQLLGSSYELSEVNS